MNGFLKNGTVSITVQVLTKRVPNYNTALLGSNTCAIYYNIIYFIRKPKSRHILYIFVK